MEIQHSFNQNDFINEGIIKGIIIKKTIKENYVVFKILTKYNSSNINLSGILLKDNKEMAAGFNTGNFVELKGYITLNISKSTKKFRQSFVITEIKRINNISSILFPYVSSDMQDNRYRNYFRLKGFVNNITDINNTLTFVTISTYNCSLQILNKAIITINKRNIQKVNDFKKGDIIELLARLKETPINCNFGEKQYFIEPLVPYYINRIKINSFEK